MTPLAPLAFTAPTINYGLFAPVLFVLGAACVGILVEAFAPRALRFQIQVALSLIALAAAFVNLVLNWGIASRALIDPVTVGQVVTGSLIHDGATQVMWAMLLGFGFVSLLLFAERRVHGGVTAFTPMAAATPGSKAETEAAEAGLEHTEAFPLALFSLSGMLLIVAANDLLTMFVALEILSFPLYVLCGLARHRRLLSQESALKYFLLGSGASAMLLFGVALVFGYSGSFAYDGIVTAVTLSQESDRLLIGGVALIAVGLLFKIGAVPFHAWVPDVYQGAPTPVTSFMAVCTKIAAAGALLRIFYVCFGGARLTWQPVIAAVAILTMIVGTVVAIVQTDIKRLLAYSSVAHAGFLLTAVTGAATTQSGLADGQLGSVGAILFYLIGYGFATIGCFAVVTVVRAHGREATELSQWAGLGRRYPVIGISMVILLLSLAGIPLTAGFVGKFAVFTAAWQGGYWWLALVAVLVSVVAVYIYLRVIIVLFFREPAGEAEVTIAGPMTLIVLAISLIGTLVLGIAPAPVTNVIAQAAEFLHAVAG
ncbi:MAG: NADH-quinone oxidoreductase subunit NuoN [Propionibacteriaceae bacterium]|jgi:NADH-quinone oxidoreductase subunit N|nr:NADH-quinone oxidoreductase subunit NuoN [Propionibacteriaceae bacterium]